MIGAEHIGKDECVLHPSLQCRAHQDIIYPPTNIASPRIGKIRPPAIVSVPLMKEAKCIHESGVNEVLKSLPFFLSKSMLTLILLGIRQIIRRVRDIEITAKNHRFLFFQYLTVC